ncbi:hypothetical protein RHGRI_014426 [Rhododendron griersonianum]|uniref:Uncharacterized protein n=1 Tax=Rhododendron griersonianum TaxID=479676 RepID=A0AAV6K9M2_9ERIC|nr:hypothetical protein RHGRI_014426 [Rhododendron griersonianum]
MVHAGQEVVMIGGSHALHRHEKLAIALSKAMRGHSLQNTKKDGRFHVHTKTHLDGAILKEEMERSAHMLAAGLLEMSDPSLSSKFFLRQNWIDPSDSSSTDSILKHKTLWATYTSKRDKGKKKKTVKKQGDLYRTYGTRVIPVLGIHEVIERNLFEQAVIERHENVFNLLVHQMSEHKQTILGLKDSSNNNILHLAGRLAPQNKPTQVSGAALQMQRELQWFKCATVVAGNTKHDGGLVVRGGKLLKGFGLLVSRDELPCRCYTKDEYGPEPK